VWSIVPFQFLLWLALFDKLDVHVDGYRVAHEQAAGFQSCVPGEAKVFPADPRRGRNPNSRISPRVSFAKI